MATLSRQACLHRFGVGLCGAAAAGRRSAVRVLVYALALGGGCVSAEPQGSSSKARAPRAATSNVLPPVVYDEATGTLCSEDSASISLSARVHQAALKAAAAADSETDASRLPLAADYAGRCAESKQAPAEISALAKTALPRTLDVADFQPDAGNKGLLLGAAKAGVLGLMCWPAVRAFKARLCAAIERREAARAQGQDLDLHEAVLSVYRDERNRFAGEVLDGKPQSRLLRRLEFLVATLITINASTLGTVFYFPATSPGFMPLVNRAGKGLAVCVVAGTVLNEAADLVWRAHNEEDLTGMCAGFEDDMKRYPLGA